MPSDTPLPVGKPFVDIANPDFTTNFYLHGARLKSISFWELYREHGDQDDDKNKDSYWHFPLRPQDIAAAMHSLDWA